MLTRHAFIAVFSIVAAAFSSAAEKPLSALERTQVITVVERFIQEATARSTAPWDELSTPVLQVENLQRESDDLVVLDGCEFQPTLLYPAVRVRAVIIRTRNRWRVASLTSSGVCRPHPI